MIYVINDIITGALIGLLYALVAMGFVVIYRASKVFNFAQGELVILGGFIVWYTTFELGLDLWLAIPLSLLLSALAGYLIERIFLTKLIGESVFSMVMVTVGLLILLRGIVLLLFGPAVRPFPVIFPLKPLFLGEMLIPMNLLIGGLITVVAAVGLSWFFNRTRAGLRMTAVAEDHVVASSMGISVKGSIAFAWVLGAVLSTVGAMIFLSGKSLTFLASEIGFAALPVALFAGLESIGGLILAGVIVGVAQSLATNYLDPLVGGALGTVVPYLIMLGILLIRPTGLFGWRTIERV
ncbi:MULTISPECIES: branched-chain amino acid ABC transporter permease [Phyllobacteriaceae]|jgi:branched-chain amino acid transport system permease protein|uniref:Branched-chain amino acid ABC transporter permease n=2 Tax=Phyllobacteriaceae TaxID=69277 RepID=A0ABV3WYD8_9HYPH|nr:branched-chain amino acid ABC transporter permease [Mesorhizobium sediminum]MCV0398322.1 branched-chain amino acid ABC transporter permease [Rhizobiaceae bacterium]MCV0406674.1 branched-chain amino acid ABC transporter permease [Rhizobiaceae bacterium]NRC57124.1 branched-chain amino acid ABC transporter permease [Mesorhizobium sediminum]